MKNDTAEKSAEFRAIPTELRVEDLDDAKRIVGYAAVFNRDSIDLGGFTEEISPGAFAESIQSDDIRALMNHDPNLILGRTKAGTLRLEEDDIGLRMEIDLPDTQLGRDLAESIRRGDVTGASFGFRTIEDDWNTKDGKPHRTLKAAKLYDTGPVIFPAYSDTSVAVRSLESWRNGNTGKAEDVSTKLGMLMHFQRQKEATLK